MKQFALLTAIVMWGCSSALADLDSEVRAVLQDKLLHRAATGIQVVRLGAGQKIQVVYSLDSEVPLVPASNLKLATTSAALDGLGTDFKFRTILARAGEDLVIVGDGDPTFGDAELLKRANWDVTTVFQHWAEQLHRLHLETVGDVIVDDGVFDETFVHPSWPANQLDKRYVAEVGGINLNANCVDFSIFPTSPGSLVSYTVNPPTQYLTVRNTCVTGNENAVGLSRDALANTVLLHGQTPGRGSASVSVTIHDPPMFAGEVLAETLRAGGIRLTGKVRRDRTVRLRHEAGGLKWVVVGVHETPLATALARANKDSVNLYAESLCKRLGYAMSKGQKDATGSWSNGTAAVGAFLLKTGTPVEQFSLDDGSGLSKQNRISPNAICHLLSYNFAGPNRQAFMDSLAIAGVDGTLDDRFRGSDIRRRLFGKSGFVEGVSSLSGYLSGKDGNWYAFSILMNGIPHLSNSEIKLLQERIIKAVDLRSAVATARS